MLQKWKALAMEELRQLMQAPSDAVVRVNELLDTEAGMRDYLKRLEDVKVDLKFKREVSRRALGERERGACDLRAGSDSVCAIWVRVRADGAPADEEGDPHAAAAPGAPPNRSRKGAPLCVRARGRHCGV